MTLKEGLRLAVNEFASHYFVEKNGNVLFYRKHESKTIYRATLWLYRPSGEYGWQTWYWLISYKDIPAKAIPIGEHPELKGRRP
jgi:hypothetical protein